MIVLDTNALYAYYMDFSARRRDGRLVRVRRRNRDEVVAEVDGAIKTRRLRIPGIAAVEVRGGLEKSFRRRPSRPARRRIPTLKL